MRETLPRMTTRRSDTSTGEMDGEMKNSKNDGGEGKGGAESAAARSGEDSEKSSSGDGLKIAWQYRRYLEKSEEEKEEMELERLCVLEDGWRGGRLRGVGGAAGGSARTRSRSRRSGPSGGCSSAAGSCSAAAAGGWPAAAPGPDHRSALAALPGRERSDVPRSSSPQPPSDPGPVALSSWHHSREPAVSASAGSRGRHRRGVRRPGAAAPPAHARGWQVEQCPAKPQRQYSRRRRTGRRRLGGLGVNPT